MEVSERNKWKLTTQYAVDTVRVIYLSVRFVGVRVESGNALRVVIDHIRDWITHVFYMSNTRSIEIIQQYPVVSKHISSAGSLIYG
jgi:hypothetical protein